jgi:uncharacterized membrane protein
MKYLRKPYLYLASGIAVLTFLVFLFFYGRMPEIVPLHWNWKGQIDRYGSKGSLLLMGGLPLLLVFILSFLPKIDPRRESYERHSKAYSIFLLYITLFLCLISLTVFGVSLGYPLNVPQIVRILVGLLLIGFGNYLGQVRPNYFFGIRTPWALASERNWRKTQRFGAWVMVLSGFAFIIVPLVLGTVGFVISLFLLFAGMAVVFVYSYLLLRKHGAN